MAEVTGGGTMLLPSSKAVIRTRFRFEGVTNASRKSSASSSLVRVLFFDRFVGLFSGGERPVLAATVSAKDTVAACDATGVALASTRVVSASPDVFSAD